MINLIIKPTVILIKFEMFGLLVTGLKGMGYGMITIPTIINFYYTVIMAWGFQYMFEGHIYLLGKHTY